jgi:hypothetical protein
MNTDLIKTRDSFPLPARNEWGEGQGEGRFQKTFLLYPTLSSIGWRRGSFLNHDFMRVHPCPSVVEFFL